jgi:hypothetical protein
MFSLKLIKKILFYVVLIYFFFVAVLYVTQRSMIYFPSYQKPDITPFEKEGVFEITTQTSDGVSLTGWMKNPEPEKPIIIFWHGNASNLPSTLYKASFYAEQGYGILLAAYRGYGGNEGKPSEQGFYQDARAWIQKLQSLGFKNSDFILYGESIGTGVATQMATEFEDVQALILESPYTSLPDVAAKTYFFVPVRFLMKDHFDNLSKIQNVNAPVFIIKGSKDNIIPPSHGQALFNQAEEPKEILKLEGYGHNNLPQGEIAVSVIKFLENL